MPGHKIPGMWSSQVFFYFLVSARHNPSHNVGILAFSVYKKHVYLCNDLHKMSTKVGVSGGMHMQ